MAPDPGRRTGREDGSGCEGLHLVEDVGVADIAVRYVCRSCGSSVAVEFPTQRNWADVRTWLNCHPSATRDLSRPSADSS